MEYTQIAGAVGLTMFAVGLLGAFLANLTRISRLTILFLRVFVAGSIILFIGAAATIILSVSQKP